MSSTPQRVMRSYTRGLRIPILIGRFSDGVSVPGGPYTITQVLLGGSSIVLGYLTLGLWAGLLPTLAVLSPSILAHLMLLPLGWGVAYLAGMLPSETNPVRGARDVLSGGAPARYGLRAGRRVDGLPKPVTVRSRVLIQAAPLAGAAVAGESVTEDLAPVSTDVRAVPVETGAAAGGASRCATSGVGTQGKPHAPDLIGALSAEIIKE